MPNIEHTQEKDRLYSFRSLMIMREDADAQSLVTITSARSVNMALDGEAPRYLTVPEMAETNHELGLMLLDLARELLAHPHLPSLPAIAAASPLPVS